MSGFKQFIIELHTPLGSKKNDKAPKRNRKTGKSYIGKTKRASRIERALTEELALAKNQHIGRTGYDPFPLKCDVRIDIWPGANAGADDDNSRGHLYDALELSGVIEDDKQIAQSWRDRLPKRDVTMIVLRIAQSPPEPPYFS